MRYVKAPFFDGFLCIISTRRNQLENTRGVFWLKMFFCIELSSWMNLAVRFTSFIML